MKEEIYMNTKTEEKVMQEVRAAEEALKSAQDASEKVFEEIEETIFNGAEELMGTAIGETILMNVLENCSDFSRDWWGSNDAEIEADEALRYVIWKAEKVLNKKIKSYYVG
jgi:ABC-type xylose transport system substrate-binding protein